MTNTPHILTPDSKDQPSVEAFGEWPFLVSPRTQRVLRTIGVLGMVVAVVGAAVVWRFLGDLERNTERSLVIGEEAAATLVDTVDIADEVVAGLDDGLGTVATIFKALDDVITSTGDLAASTASLTGQLPTRLEEIDNAFASLQSIGETVDDTLSALSDIPFGPNYNPDRSLADSVAEIRASFDPLQDDLEAIATELSTFADGSDGLQRELISLAGEVERTRASLDGTDAVLDRYRDTAEDARQLAASSRPDLAASMTATRWVVVLVAMLIAVGQLVPWVVAGLRRTPPVQHQGLIVDV